MEVIKEKAIIKYPNSESRFFININQDMCFA